MVIKAKYENGVFKPLDKVRLQEGTALEIYLPSDNNKGQSIRNLAFTGIWNDRKDIKDGVSYVDRLREKRRT